MAFENTYGGIDFQAGNKMAMAQQDQFSRAIGQGMAAYNAAQDRKMQMAQLEARKQAAQTAAAGDYKQVAMDELNRIAQGGAPTPQGQAAVKVMQQITPERTFFDPETGQKVVQSSPWQSVMGGSPQRQEAIVAQSAPQNIQPFLVDMNEQQVLEAISEKPTQKESPSDIPLPQTPKLPKGLEGTPRGDRMKWEAMNKMGEKQWEAQLKFTENKLKTEKGKNQVGNILNRMSEINEELKKRDAIMTGGEPLNKRIGNYLQTSGAGQEARKILDPETQSFAEEYRALQATLLPFYATAAGLGAKSLDSEGERKSILDSFGAPDGIYESNTRQLDTLRKTFGIPIEGRQAVNPQPSRPTPEQIRAELNKRRGQ